MGSMSRKAGKPVKFNYSAQPGAKAVAIPILDADDTVITLKSYERLIVDEVSFNTDAAADTGDLAYLIEAAAAPAAIPTSGVLVAFSIAVNLGTQGTVFPGEGYSCHLANTLWLYDNGTTLENTDVVVAGTGRIVNVTQGPQAGYKALLTPGGVPGQEF